MKMLQKHDLFPGPAHRRGPGFRSSLGRGFMWQGAAFVLLMTVSLLGALYGGKHMTLDPSLSFPCGIAVGLLTLTMGGYGMWRHDQELSRTLAAGLDAPDKADLQIYIGSLASACDDFRGQAAQVLTTFLGELSEQTLSCISDFYWRTLCPNPGSADTANMRLSRYAHSREDDFDVAIMSAVMKVERMDALPYIDGLRKRIDEKPHSARYRNTLTQCHELLIANRDNYEQSATLLRRSEAPTSRDTLLRPLSETRCRKPETGEQLLRGTTREDPGASSQKEA